ncbi:ABC transporter permease [Selenomonas sp. TAMA-11512]|uniref:ABC transporter permease n=1 Tax=Selenomonas sp. TAMA-11512 TaxID=3095337 RepID=UPI0030879FE2|nr:ABC transporter permease [Selenomonas sp. TAMA-11512]
MGHTLHAILVLARKELQVIFADPRMRVAMLVPAFLQGMLFGYAANYNLKVAPFVLVDMAHTSESRSFAAKLTSTNTFHLTDVLGSPAEVAERIDSGEARIAVIIPEDFSRNLISGRAAPVEVVVDGKNTLIAGQATSYLLQIAAEYNREMGLGASITVTTRTWYNENQTTQWNFLPALIAMISFVQVMLLGGLSIAREREQGTLDQLLVTPLSPTEILAGKSIPPMLIGLVQSTILLCIANFYFQVPFRGSLLTLYAVLFIFIQSTTGFALALSAVSKTMQQVMVYIFVSILPLVLLSGMATPIDNMPEVLQYLTYLDPLRFAMEAVRRVYLEGATVMEIADRLLPMIVIGMAAMPLAGSLFRKEV